MTDDTARPGDPTDVGAYCRAVERHLTRVNGGHLVRIVGPGFDLVRRWAEDGVPLSVVRRAVEAKAERHAGGRAKRPLRIEFCETDVRAAFEQWRRAVGAAAGGSTAADGTADAGEDGRRPSLSKHLERAIERASRSAGRTDVPEPLREFLGALAGDLGAIRDQAKQVRGAARQPLIARLATADEDLRRETRAAATPSLLTELEAEAVRDLSLFRERLEPGAWQRAIDVTVDRLLRDRFGLPALDL